MRKIVLLGLLIPLLAPFLRAQSIQTLSPQQCIWHAGDNPAWSAPSLDETGWQPYTQWKLNPDQPRYWVRCHADLSALRGAQHPALQISLYAAYQIYLDGALLGGSGNLRSGFFSIDTIRSFPVPALSTPQAATLALRITYRYSALTLHMAGQAHPSTQPLLATIRAGDEQTLNGFRANAILAQITDSFFYFLAYGVIGVLGFALLGQFLQDRSRRDLLLLAVASISAAGINASFFFAPALLNLSIGLNLGLFATSALVIAFARTWFFFAVAKRRVPLLFWAIMGLDSVRSILLEVGLCLSLGAALRLTTIYDSWVTSVAQVIDIAAGFAPFVAFWPWRRITRHALPLALLCMFWGATMAFFFATGYAAWGPLFGPSAHGIQRWHVAADLMQASVTLAVLIALMAVLSRDQRRTTRERAELAGELHAASNIQRMLAPAVIETAPGLKIDVAFHPMHDVGGDFYLSRVLPNGRQRVLIGDVSGKGAAAAMAATLLLGAAAARDQDLPGALLAQSNRVLQENHLGGFATCLCADIAQDGTVTLANAGHLAPYRNGEEIPVESGLPLGVTAAAAYTETTLILAPGDTLTFLSDGVVEAQDATGALFGFDRTRAISTQSAEEIAQAASAYGQRDDITVLTLTFSPASVAAAAV
ncbi:MAG TPA: PP2C family protein-serine/threonine phosphatase [Acidobacteriaceae bacterium]